MSEKWYFDPTDGTVVQGKERGWTARMGPYDTEVEARNALELARARNEIADAWDEDES